MRATDVTDLLARYRIAGLTEAVVQDQIERALRQEGIEYEREVELAPRDRIDFMVGPVGIEVKIKGTRAQIIRQLARYVRNDRVEEIDSRTKQNHLREMAAKALRDAHGTRKEALVAS